MARWRLLQPHYLPCPGNTWTQREVDRVTGKQVQRMYPVPRLLDPKDPVDWTVKHNRDEGEVNVCYEGKGEARDIVFAGDPTPDMEPIDDEARAISKRFEASGQWKHPINDLPAQGGSYTDGMMADWHQQMANLQAAQPISAGVGLEQFNELQVTMQAMLAQNEALLKALVATPRRL